MPAFDYPIDGVQRKHGPQGYSGYASFRAWLRDDFSFRCTYCLIREQWGRVTGEFDLDHFIAQTTSPSEANKYDNLVYSCARCNAMKSAQEVPDPSIVFTANNLVVRVDGILESYSDSAEALIEKLDLNSPEMISWRELWMRIVELARDNDTDLHQRLLGFPQDLPDLSRLRPPGGNSRPDGVKRSYFAQAARGELPPTY